MIDRQSVFEMHRMKNDGFSIRKICNTLGISPKTVVKYLNDPNPRRKIVKRVSKLNPFKDEIARLLKVDPKVSAVVIKQRIDKLGFDGEITIIRNYLRKIRNDFVYRQPFIRFESSPGKQIQIDWGHFGSLTYGNANRKLYAMAVTESYSRMLYLEFTHSQKQETLHQCLLNAFRFLDGAPKEIVVDNMLTAVTERQGRLIRFNDAFLDFLRIFKIFPVACNVRAPHEKGKVERSIRYVRQNFWPLRSFKNLFDVQRQVIKWLDNVANVRVHQTTGQSPKERFADVLMTKLPGLLPDCRETCRVLVHKEFAVRFDGNAYTAPPWTIGKHITLKADQSTVTLYYHQKKVAAHNRCWKKKKRIEIPAHNEQVKKLQNRLWQDKHVAAFSSMGQPAVDFLHCLVLARQPVKKSIARLLSLKDEYGSFSLLYALEKAMEFKAYGADYVENILYQEMTPKNHHLPVKLKNDELNRIRLTEPCLADYDAYIIKRREKND